MARKKKIKDYIICERIKEARTHAGLSQKEMSYKLNIPLQTYKNWEQKRNIPDQTNIKKIAAICDTDPTWIMHIDIESIIADSRNIIHGFNPSKSEVIRPVGIKERSKLQCILEALTMCGYGWNEINDKDNFLGFIDSPIESLKNSIELYMKTINPTIRKEEKNEKKHDADY